MKICKNCGHTESEHKPINTQDGPAGTYCEGSPNCTCLHFEAHEEAADSPSDIRSARPPMPGRPGIQMYPAPGMQGGLARRGPIPSGRQEPKRDHVLELRKGMVAVMVAGMQGDFVTANKWSLWLRTHYQMPELEAALSQLTDMRPSLARGHLTGEVVVPNPTYRK